MEDRREGLLTVTQIDAALAKAKRTGRDEWLPDSTIRGEGRLFFRAQPTGGRWYFRYTLADGRRDALAMKPYAERGRTKADSTGGRYTLQGAREKAREYGSMLKRPETANVRATLAAAQLAAEAEQRAAVEKAKDEKRERDSKSNTLGRLAALYAEHLKAQGKVSAAKVRSDLERHLASHSVAQLVARDVTRRDVASLVREIAETSGPRMAGIVRSYLSAAFTLALDAESNPKASAALIAFNVEANPVLGVKAESSKIRDRALSAAELRAFLRRLRTQPGAVTDALLCCLLSGGQRPQQLIRAGVADFDSETAELRLRDAKGKRAAARLHIVPLAADGAALVEALAARSKALSSPHLFTSSGTKALDIGTLSWRVTETSRAMVEAGEASEPFQMKDLRRTVETMLASLGVSKDVRAQLLSHGLSGVQSVNYDRHAYFDEKRAALTKWERRLHEIENGRTTKVVPLRG